jgi:hypothetical protein
MSTSDPIRWGSAGARPPRGVCVCGELTTTNVSIRAIKTSPERRAKALASISKTLCEQCAHDLFVRLDVELHSVLGTLGKRTTS